MTKDGAVSAKDHPRSKSLAETLRKIQQGPDADWTQDELVDCLHWQKQVTAVLIGIVWGIIAFKGWEAMVVFLVVQLGLTVLFYRFVMRVDEERYGGPGEMLVENAPAFVSLFLVVWIITYNAVHVQSLS